MMDRKTHPDPSPHEVEESLGAPYEEGADNVFATPADAIGRTGEGRLDDDALSPELIQQLDHAGLDANSPADDSIPGTLIEDHPKGIPARWGKAGP